MRLPWQSKALDQLKLIQPQPVQLQAKQLNRETYGRVPDFLCLPNAPLQKFHGAAPIPALASWTLQRAGETWKGHPMSDLTGIALLGLFLAALFTSYMPQASNSSVMADGVMLSACDSH